MDPKVENGAMQGDEVPTWGKSLPVPSVQEMVRKDHQFLSERYIQEHKDRAVATNLSPTTSEIPIINFSLLINGDKDERRKLDTACKEWGFFQITNHDVSEEVIKQMKAAVAAFFELPLEEKRNYAMAANDIHGYGQGYVVSEHQKLDWCDLMFLVTSPPKYQKMKYWPVTIPGFKEAVEQYSTEILKLTEDIFANISLLMGMDKDALKRLHGEMMKQGIRMNYYPTCSRPELVLGVGPHSDASSITFLLQDDDITGLQIRHEEGWVPVKPIPNAIVVNIGDVIESWSNGVYKSIEHRAVTSVTATRMSIATFVIPDDDVELGPVETMADDYNRPKMYKAIKYVDYLRHTLSKKMDGKANTELLKVEIESN
ncbi:S-norcoclaurine synthase 1 isoform X2 [Populus trichocarpa]|uniref:S-norcoclaurine synthase 1 isoform X2 n=1 Tax=Populus trichocarpa TaxID=3694 RepID=UPI002277E8FD|nr:S-norcoclaurine synthase 1 isoform X2 [Populus trichocarpa]